MRISRAEAARLLTLASSWDNRNVGEAAVAAYVESGDLGRWSFMEAAEAIKHYYTTTTDTKPWVMPSHITHYIKNLRQDRALRAEGRELVAGTPDPRVLEMADQVARRLAIPEKFRPTGQPGLSVECPYCNAQPGQPCTRQSHGGAVEVPAHPSRLDVAEGRAAG